MAPPPASTGGTPRFQFFQEVRSTSQRGMESTEPRAVRWRLLAANHRCLGVAARPHPSLAEARAGAARVAAEAARSTSRVTFEPTAGWSWTMLLDGEAVARSGRGYSRRVECEIALRQFVELAPVSGFIPRLASFRRRGF